LAEGLGEIQGLIQDDTQSLPRQKNACVPQMPRVQKQSPPSEEKRQAHGELPLLSQEI
jgi:hypothetical protein